MYGAIALVLLGLTLLLVWLTRPNQPLGVLFATDTPTPTLTFTPTETPPATETPTITPTPTETITPTPSEAFPYTIQEGDSLDALAQRFNLGEDGILLILDENPDLLQNNGIIFVGQTIQIPPPGRTRATSTPIPNLPRGTLIEYRVLPGDTLAGIAVRFNSLTEDIIEENEIEDANALQVGDVLQIPVNLVTPTATLPPTSTPVTPTLAGGQPTATQPAGGSGATPAAACDFEENASSVTQLQTLINNERTGDNLSALTVNEQLAAAAEAHAIDMLCNNYLGHLGSDGSTPASRVAAQGFTASLVLENLYAAPVNAGNPQAAIDWWMSDPASRADILNEDTTVFGVAYVSSQESMLGSYFVVVSANP